MRCLRHVGALALLVVAWSAPLAAAQGDAALAPLILTFEQQEDFLRNARIITSREVSQGVTNTRRATLSDGRMAHDAQIQTVDVSLSVFKPPTGPSEMNFRDSYRYNIAAYRVARLLELDNVPVSVERTVNGRRAAITWWVDDVIMTEGDRVKKQTRGPNPERTAMQVHVMRVFDELIANRDRNAGNLLWTKDWTMWMIDHTRSFRLGTGLQRPALLERVERSLLQHMRGLTAAAMGNAADNSLTRFEIEALLGRRDAIVTLFETKIAERGESAVLYTLAR